MIPIIRQSVPTPFPSDIEKFKQEELTKCTQQAIEAIEVLQKAIDEVAKSKESWKRFFAAGKYMERMAEARKRVETAIDIIQKHLIVDTKKEVLKITAMLKTVWGDLTDMHRDVAELKGRVDAGFAEMKLQFRHVNEKLDKILEQEGKFDKILDMDAKLDQILGTDAKSEIPPTHALIPPEVPDLPVALQTRPALLTEMKHRVLSQASSGPTAVVGVARGAAATTSAHGMGGVGKTTAAVQLIRDPEVGAAFHKLLWVSVSQVELLKSTVPSVDCVHVDILEC